MTTSTPPWMANYTPDMSPPANKWRPGMKSPNPGGRPPGIIDKRQRIAQAFMEDAQKIAKVVVDAALGGDLQAANIVLSRLSPVLKARAEKVTFSLDPDAPLTNQAQAVLVAVAAGDVDPETGKLLIDSIGAFAGLRQVDELSARIDAIEARTAIASTGQGKGGVLCV